MHSQGLEHSYLQDIERLATMLKSNKYIVIIPHANADPDALASSCTLAYIAKTLNRYANITILVPEGFGIECRKIASICMAHNINIVIVKKSSDEYFSGNPMCILVDTASLEQLKILKNSLARCNSIVIIDHHVLHDQSLENTKTLTSQYMFIFDQNASSTSEILFEIAEYLKVSIPSNIMEAIIAGMIWDTKRFMRATQKTFKYLSEMLYLGADYYKAQQLISSPKPHQAKIAKIKCVLRHRGFKLTVQSNDVYVAVSEVGAYESDCASSLINIGYDIVFVASEEETLKATRVIYRIRDESTLPHNVDVYNNILKSLIEKYGGGGGGHKLAGGALINIRDSNIVLKELIMALSRLFGGEVKELTEIKVLEGASP